MDGKNLDATLEAARNHLFLVTINGADKDAKDWDHLIQPLDKGDYDVSLLLHRLAELKYPGPIGLQHYGIKGSAEHNLARSMHAWKKLSANPSAPTSYSK